MSIPWPFPRGGEREGKVTNPGEDLERESGNNPWALPKWRTRGVYMEIIPLALF